MRVGVGPSESVVFEQLQYGTYRDGIAFSNGKKISLQLLGPGVTITLERIQEKTNVDCEHAKILELIA